MTQLRNALFSLIKKFFRLLPGADTLRAFPLFKQWHSALNFHLKQESVLVEGLSLFVNREDRMISQMLMREKVYEPVETVFFRSNVREGDVFLDIGANIGYFTLLAAARVGAKGKVFSFEPDPTNFAFLEKSVRMNHLSQVTALKAAVTDKTGKLKLFRNEDNLGDHRIYATDSSAQSIDIDSVCLDDYLPPLEGARIVVKIDIQGAEVSAIRGLSRFFSGHSDVTLLTEFWPEGLRRFGSSSAEYASLLVENRFKLFLIESSGALKPVTREELLASFPQGDPDAYKNVVCKKG